MSTENPDTSAMDRGEPAKFREYQEGSTRRDPVVSPWVGQVHPDDLPMFQAFGESFREAGESFRSTEFCKRSLRASANRYASECIDTGQMYPLQNMVGETSNRRDMSGVHTIRKLRDKLSRPAYVAYMHGVMGDGKTDFALLLAEIWEDEMQSEGYDTVLASNIRTWEAAESIDTWDGFEAWLDDAEQSERRLFVFDEASKHASGYAQDAQQARELLGKTINLIRKSYASIILIGHTGKDVHADIRRKATHLIRKEGKKETTFRTRIDSGQGEGDVRDELQIGGVPPTSYVYDTYESSNWDWCEAEDVEAQLEAQLRQEVQEKKTTRNEAIRTLVDWKPGVTNSQLAELGWVDVSAERVRQIRNETKQTEAEA